MNLKNFTVGSSSPLWLYIEPPSSTKNSTQLKTSLSLKIMADTMIADMPTNTNPTRSKKGGRTRKALKPTNQSPDEPITLAGVVATPPEDSAAGKENHESLSQPKKTKSKKKPDLSSNFEKELEEMQEKLQQLRIEKEQTEEMVKARDEMLKQKDEEIKKLQKIKEFKPTMVRFLDFLEIFFR